MFVMWKKSKEKECLGILVTIVEGNDIKQGGDRDRETEKGQNQGPWEVGKRRCLGDRFWEKLCIKYFFNKKRIKKQLAS